MSELYRCNEKLKKPTLIAYISERINYFFSFNLPYQSDKTALSKKVKSLQLTDEEIDNLEEEEVAIIEEITRVLEGKPKDKLPALRDIPKKKL